jgi:inner membrane protein involved in colicin E2 resistance
MLELAKSLKLVAPITMSADAQMVWLQAAVDALEDIRADEVAAVSMEIRRSVTRPAQIVPAIAEKVDELRKRRAHEREMAAWRERQALAPPEMPVREEPKPPLSEAEIAKMPKWLIDTGLRVGFLKRVGDRVVDADCIAERGR